MVEVNEKLTRYVAQLARLALTDQEVTLFTGQMSKVLGYVEKLQELNTQGVEPMTHPFDLTAPLREDVIVPSPKDAEGKPKVLSSAPDVLYDGYKVPPIL